MPFDANAGSKVSLKRRRPVLPAVCRLCFCLMNHIYFPNQQGRTGLRSWGLMPSMHRASDHSRISLPSVERPHLSVAGRVQDLAQGRLNRGNEREQAPLQRFPHTHPASRGFEPVTLGLGARIASADHDHGLCRLRTICSDLAEINKKRCHLVRF